MAALEAQKEIALQEFSSSTWSAGRIVGANGLGFESARRLIALGHTAYLGARDRERGEAAAQRMGARFVPIDVTDDASVAAAAAWIERQKTGLDVLINNAGIAGDRCSVPPMHRSSSNVSSALGSFAAVTDPRRLESKFPLLGYCSSVGRRLRGQTDRKSAQKACPTIGSIIQWQSWPRIEGNCSPRHEGCTPSASQRRRLVFAPLGRQSFRKGRGHADTGCDRP
jgi:hypothetical protein